MNKDNLLKSIVYGIPLVIALFVLPILIYTFYSNNFDLSRKASTQNPPIEQVQIENQQNPISPQQTPHNKNGYIPCDESIFPSCSEGMCPEQYRCGVSKNQEENTCRCIRYK